MTTKSLKVQKTTARRKDGPSSPEAERGYSTRRPRQDRMPKARTGGGTGGCRGHGGGKSRTSKDWRTAAGRGIVKAR